MPRDHLIGEGVHSFKGSPLFVSLSVDLPCLYLLMYYIYLFIYLLGQALSDDINVEHLMTLTLIL